MVYSARSLDDIIYRRELESIGNDSDVRLALTLTRSAPPDWSGYHRRVDRAMLDEVAWSAAQNAHAFVCGPTPLVESVASLLVDMGYDPARVRTERFGPTG